MWKKKMEYLSKEGYDKIAAELYQLEHVEFPRLTEALAEARAQGDLSENFEYHANKRAHGKMISRMNFLQKVLKFSKVLDTKNMSGEKVTLLSKVTFADVETGQRMTYTIVSRHEMNVREGKISKDSPIGMALMGRTVGETVEVVTPAKTMRVRIEEIALE